MSVRAFRRLFALGLVGLWLAPSVGALTVGLHVALEHGGHHDAAPAHAPEMFDELVAAVVHGHHHGHDHGVDAPPHDHPAHLEAAPGLSSGPSSALSLPAEPGAAIHDGPCRALASRHRRPPPVPLFRAHCSLLL